MYRILVATPTLGFGEIIRQSLEEAGAFQVVITSGCETAVQLATKEPYALAILDSDLEDCFLPELAVELQAAAEQQGEKLHLLIIPPDEISKHDFEAIEIDGFLSKPFYLPDLQEQVSQILGIEEKLESELPGDEQGDEAQQSGGRRNGSGKNALRTGTRAQPEPAPGWFQDADQVQRVLEDGFAESMACGAFVLRYDQVWASAGQIPIETSQELGISLAQQWSKGSGTDLARFVHLEVCGGDCMLYTTNLGDEYLLAIIFEAERPFSLIRKQAGKLARRLRQTGEHNSNAETDIQLSEEVQEEAGG